MSQNRKTTPKPSPKNTLFNYFAKNTPKTPQNVEISGTEQKSVKKEEKSLTGKMLDFGESKQLKCL